MNDWDEFLPNEISIKKILIDILFHISAYIRVESIAILIIRNLCAWLREGHKSLAFLSNKCALIKNWIATIDVLHLIPR